MINDKEFTYHPSQVNIGFTRVNGGGDFFYGSDVETNSYIELKIRRSEVKREAGLDMFFPTGQPILQLRMTNIQFASLLTSMNYESGIPATLERINQGDLPSRIEAPPKFDKAAFVYKTVSNLENDYGKDLGLLRTEIQELKISKLKKERLMHKLDVIEAGHKRNLKFWVSQAKKEIVTMMADAKSNIEAFYMNLLMGLGLKTAKKDMAKLIEKNKVEINSTIEYKD